MNHFFARRLLVSIGFVAAAWSLSAQDQEHEPFTGQWRSFAMGTINHDTLPDYFTTSFGGRLAWKSPVWNNFQLNAAYYASIFTGWGNHQKVVDGLKNRYEVGNYDINNPEKREIYFLGEASIKYSRGNTTAELGRMKKKSPFINPQDGRMIPNLIQGLWITHLSEDRKLSADFAYITHIAPRSTSRFYSVQGAFQYPSGRSVFGVPSNYAQQVNSNFIAIGHVSYAFSPQHKVQIWDYAVDRVMNTLYADYAWVPNAHWKWGIQGVYQGKWDTGGNTDPALTYFYHDRASVWGTELQWKPSHTAISLAYNGFSKSGRFLFPRSWGREGLYTFQKRERSEGVGDAHNLVLTLSRSWSDHHGSKLDFSVGNGVYFRAAPEEAEFNKYGMPSFTQTNLDLFFRPSGALKGLTLEFLAVYKGLVGRSIDSLDPKYVHNKVNMLNYQVVLNYNF